MKLLFSIFIMLVTCLNAESSRTKELSPYNAICLRNTSFCEYQPSYPYLWTLDTVMIWKQCVCMKGCLMRIQHQIDYIRESQDMSMIDEVEHELNNCNCILGFGSSDKTNK